MKTPRIVNAIEKIDDDLVSAAAESKRKKNNRVGWGALAACLVVLIIAGITVIPSLLDDNTAINPEQSNSETADSQDSSGKYKNFTVNTSESTIIWPWEYMTESERYYDTEINGIRYEKNGGRTIPEESIGDLIGSYNIVGYDEYSEEAPTVFCEVYRLKTVSETQYVAVKISDSYYVFKNSVYDPPQTLGELFRRTDLSKLFKLERFSENGDGPDSNHYVLNDDEYIWQILADCEEAAFVDEDKEYWHIYDRDFISFTISCDTLGIYKRDFSITKDGYLSTNAFDWGYLYYIGEDAAGKIIKYAMDNSKEGKYEPYSESNYIYGKVVKVTDDYILVDDSVLCENEADGITYKILANNLYISRYIDLNNVKVDQTVKVSYEGEIDEQNSYTIDSAFSISSVSIHYEDESEPDEEDYDPENSSTVSKVVEELE